jgi:ribosomal protein S27E
MKSNVTGHTRAGRAGREIICPRCQQAAVVFHFAWSALMCSGCRAMVDKVDWRTLTQ